MNCASRSRFLRLVASVLVALFVVSVAACGGGDDAQGENGGFAGIVREPAPDVSSISLPAATAERTTMPFRARPNGLLVAYFGYLSCPDVCPTTMADLRTAVGGLSNDQRAAVDVAMTTIDPARDTADALTAYVQAFVPTGYGLRTEDQAQLRAATEAFGADYQVSTTPAGVVEVAHTAFVYVVDDQGRLRLTWSFGTKAADMRADLKRLLALVADEA